METDPDRGAVAHRIAAVMTAIAGAIMIPPRTVVPVPVIPVSVAIMLSRVLTLAAGVIPALTVIAGALPGTLGDKDRRGVGCALFFVRLFPVEFLQPD